MNTSSSPGAFFVGVFLVLGLVALYATWRLIRAVRRRRPVHEIIVRVLHLTAVSIFLYREGAYLYGEGALVPAPLEYFAIGLLLLVGIYKGVRPGSPEPR